MKIKIMKNYTDITQSKKLVEILPKESANAFYDMAEPEKRQVPIIGHPDEYYDMKDWAIPCWSLAALLQIMPHCIDDIYYLVLGKLSDNKGWYVMYDDIDHFVYLYIAKSDLIDACVEMILKLHEQKLI